MGKACQIMAALRANMLQTTIRVWLESQQRLANSSIHNCLLKSQVKIWHRNLSTSGTSFSKSQRLRCKRKISERKLTRYFVDHRKVHMIGGKGGDGFACFLSEPRKMFGGPNGGDGGNGGNIILKVDQQVKSLVSVLPVYRGYSGENGGSKNCYGAAGKNIYIKVPIGTVVKEDCEVVADLNHNGEEFVAVYGGAGGKGNRFFLANDNRAPTTTTPGELGQERILHIELKTMAHAGMVGFPNAGKSSLLRAISNAKPAVAAYPFTTLNPHVGIIHYENYEQVAVADIPGIIRGAHQNRGLGFAFLRHIERCGFLLYVLDLSLPKPWTQLQDLKYELDQYDDSLSKRPHVVIGNKFDLPESKKNLPRLKEQVEQRIIPLSALTGENLEELLLHLKELYDDFMKAEKAQNQKCTKW
ncbi:mitochondrial ribosome-associated GTPase 2 isoform X1 [Varanus komodoensis]|nr:mitochondrial ribosome-associated GTPase 2 isoform X1 [Varanus komodoensis]